MSEPIHYILTPRQASKHCLDLYIARPTA